MDLDLIHEAVIPVFPHPYRIGIDMFRLYMDNSSTNQYSTSLNSLQ